MAVPVSQRGDGKDSGKEMLKMEQVEEIRRLEGQGVSRSEIAKRLDVSRPTVMKYADRVDFQVPRPVSGRARRVRSWIRLNRGSTRCWSRTNWCGVSSVTQRNECGSVCVTRKGLPDSIRWCTTVCEGVEGPGPVGQRVGWVQLVGVAAGHGAGGFRGG